LLALTTKLNSEYAGKMHRMLEASANRAEFEHRLSAFEGIGPKTVEIFMREAGKVIF
jgi:3-methyladenine DNA glycosylase/8-oxoguanine DNA glycosylase